MNSAEGLITPEILSNKYNDLQALQTLIALLKNAGEQNIAEVLNTAAGTTQ